jgi:hypothetical protein
MNQNGLLRRLLLPAIAIIPFGLGQARADGALAIGLPSNVATQGFASGYSHDRKNMDEARQAALNSCRLARSDAGARALCSIVETFTHKCVAVAMDPTDGSPGVGWSVAETKLTAESEALARCVATAGNGRREACKIANSDCDGF